MEDAKKTRKAKEAAARGQSMRVLELLFTPMVSLYLSRKRTAATTRRAALHYNRPATEALQNFSLFSSWPHASLQKLMAAGTLTVYGRGRSIGYEKEPTRAANVFWIIAGKLTQLPTRGELLQCANELPSLQNNACKTAPAVFPHLFSDEEKNSRLSSLTLMQECCVDSLRQYGAGELVDAERCLLGGQRRRNLRCQTEVVVMQIPFEILRQEFRCLAGAVRAATVEAARTRIVAELASGIVKPDAKSIILANPALKGISAGALRGVLLHLQPRVFIHGTVICDDVYRSSTVYFVQCGAVQLWDGSAAAKEVLRRPGSAFGEHAFICHRVPDFPEQKLPAKAAAYCEVWAVPISVFSTLCGAEERLSCCRVATHHLTGKWSNAQLVTALRLTPCFTYMSELAVSSAAQALKVRVYPPGERIFAPHRPAHCGIIVVAGEVTSRAAKQNADETRVVPGRPLFFCEAMVGMGTGMEVVCVSSAIVLHGAPAAMMESMEAANCVLEEVRELLTTAQDYVDRTYGAGRSTLYRAQELALQRVKEYNSRHQERETKPKRRVVAPLSSSSSSAAAAVTAATAAESVRGKKAATGEDKAADTAMALRHELLTSLSTQLKSLQYNEMDAAKFVLFRGDLRALPVPPETPPPYRSRRCFSLDDKGDIVLCDKPPERRSTAPSAEVLGYGSRSSVASTAPREHQSSLSMAPSLSALRPLQPRTSFLPSRPPVIPPATDPGRRPTDVVLATSLRVPLRSDSILPRKSTTVSEPAMGQPRLQEMRRATRRAKDELDGFDWQKEYRNHLFRRSEGK